MAHVIAIVNQKGGVGKTTTAMNLSTALAACGKKVLLVDFDPQGNATTGFNLDKSSNKQNSYSLIMQKAAVEDTILSTSVPNLSLIPSTIHLSGAEVELVPVMAREYRLRDALKSVHDQYDYIFIDCPPSLGLLTLNALSASTEVMVPLQCEFFAMEGVSQLLQTVKLVKRNLNPNIEVGGVLLTMFDVRNKLSGMVEKEVREHLGSLVYKTLIPRNVRVSEAPSHGKPVLLYDVNCAGSQAYIRLAGEMIRRHNQLSSTKVGVAA
ncbi:MAG: AAA family ATPase [Pseudomonadota bacterium]|nr:AAA family ATPase [Pseudomonadota bacterium]